MAKRIIETKNAPAPVGPYSQAIEVGDFLFTSGQIPLNPETGEVLKGSVAEQGRLALENLKALVEASGYTLENVVKTTVFLTDMGTFGEFNAVYEEYFNASKPARSCVAVKQLPKGVDVEVEVVAKK